MDRDVNHDDIMEALGAYALDAMEPEETEAIRRHLAECPACAAEVAEHHQVAALLGNIGGEAPAHLWEQIANTIGEDPRPIGYRAPHVAEVISSEHATRGSDVRRGLRGVARRPWTLAAAAAVVAIALLSLQTVHLNDRIGTLNQRDAAQGMRHLVQIAMANPEAQTVDLLGAGTQATDAQLVVLPSGAAYLVNKALPALPSTETYQLWGRSSTSLISLGVLGNRPDIVAFSVGPAATYTTYMVTPERAGGVTRTRHAPVASSIAL